MTRELPQEDVERCVDWLDGALETEERDRFELRLAAEPDLAAAAERLIETDELLRRLDASAAALVERRARMRPWLWAGSLAAAAAVLVWVAVSLLAPRPVRAKVAVLPSFESASEFVASVPELSLLRPPGLDVLRGESVEPNVGAAEFLARSVDADASLAQRAFESRQLETTAGYFVIPLEVARPCDVVVFGFPRAGEPIALLPIRSLAAGFNLLPSERFHVSPGREMRIGFERGFLVPIGAEDLDVVVAIRAESKRDPTPAHAATADETQRALERTGWSVTRLLVREPE